MTHVDQRWDTICTDDK